MAPEIQKRFERTPIYDSFAATLLRLAENASKLWSGSDLSHSTHRSTKGGRKQIAVDICPARRGI